jgi:hypothetical protein
MILPLPISSLSFHKKKKLYFLFLTLQPLQDHTSQHELPKQYHFSCQTPSSQPQLLPTALNKHPPFKKVTDLVTNFPSQVYKNQPPSQVATTLKHQEIKQKRVSPFILFFWYQYCNFS